MRHRALRWLFLTACFVLLACALFHRQLAPERVLLPTDVPFQFAPYREAAVELGVVFPENPLVADTILQNYAWKQFAGEQWRQGRPPLWNPHILTGQPFLAAGQNASLYPLGAMFYILPLAEAYEAFAVLHFALAGIFMATFVRALGSGWLGAGIGGIAFALCGFLVVSVVWPMMVSTAIWLPLLLCAIEHIVAGRHGWRGTLGWIIVGAIVVCLQFLAGHLEISFYILATAGAYTLLRLLSFVVGAGIALPLPGGEGASRWGH